MKSKLLLVVVLGACLVLGLFFIARTDNQKEDVVVKIGVLLPLSGELATFGEKIKQGIELAQEDFPTERFTVIFEDARGLAARETLTAYRKLRNIDNVDVILGPFGPEATLAIAPRTDEENIPVIAVSLCEDRFLVHPSVYCVYPALDTGVLGIKPHLQKLGIHTVGLFTMVGDLGNLIEDTFETLEEEGTLDLLATEKINAGNHDARTALLKLMAESPDMIYIVTTPEEGHLALKQLFELGYQGYRFAQIDSTEETLRGLGVPVEGVYFPGFVSDKYQSGFIQSYQAKYAAEPDLYVALGHTAGHFVLSSLESERWSPSNLIEILWQHTDTETAIQGFSFDKNRQVSVPQVVFFYDKEGFREIE
jgi:branched-chain amino acid transport system substrate-binding protein